MFKVKKTLLLGMLVFSLVALLVVGGTMAWFTDEKEVANTFEAGTVKIELLENGSEEAIEKTNVNPGDTFDKEIKVKSVGSKKTYVRVSITPVWDDEQLETDNVELIFADGEPGTNWIDGEDGWYYYRYILEEGEETEELLSQVRIIGDKTGNEYQGKKLTVNVKSEAVQASHYAYEDAWGTLPEGVEEWSGEENPE